MRNLFACCGFALALLCSQDGAKGAVVVTLSEVGSDVVASGSGTLNLDALTSVVHSGSGSPIILAFNAQFIVGPFALVDGYSSVSGPDTFGPGFLTAATSGSGDLFGIFGGNGVLIVPDGYVSGSPLSGTATWEGASFASLGAIPGTYVWAWGTGPMVDSFTLQIGPTAIPEPGTFGLFALAGVGVMVLRRRVRG